MFGLVLLLLIVVPIVELYVLFQVADNFGWLTSMLALFAISVLGGILMKWQTAGAFGRVTNKIRKGEMPSKELVDGALMIFGGALLLTPGFFTDAVGLAMFIPPLRAIARGVILKRMNTRIATFSTTTGQTFGMTFGDVRRSRGSFIDIHEVPGEDITNETVTAERTEQPDIELPPTSPPGSDTK